LAINAAGDYVNGQGIVVYGAGATPSITTPGTPTVTPNLLNGATTWNYKVIAEDYAGGLTAASSAGTTTTGAAALGQTLFVITSASAASGTTTYTTSVAHNLQPGATVLICQFGGGTCPGAFSDSFNGVKSVQSTPTSTTFTTLDGTVYNNPNASYAESPASGQGYVMACNTLTYGSATYSGAGTLRYWIYRSQGAGAYSLAGIALGIDPYFVDCGATAPIAPTYVPSTPPASTQAGYLATTISSGGGSTTLTLVGSAGATVAGATVLHDNTPALMAAMSAAVNQMGGTVYIPSTPNNGSSPTFWAFNSLANFTTLPTTNLNYLTVLVNGSLALSQPWVLRGNMKIEGMTKRNSTFMYPGGALISGGAIPLFYGQPISTVTLKNIYLNPNNNQATSIFFDNDGSGNGAAGLIFENMEVSANGPFGRPFVGKGGFGWYFRQFTCQGGYITNNLPPPCMEFTNSSTAVVGTGNAAQIPGRVAFTDSFFNNTGTMFDTAPNPFSDGLTGISFTRTLMESAYTPFLRIGPVGFTADVSLNDASVSDSIVGSGTPYIDASGSQIQAVSITGGQTTGGIPPLLVTGYALASLNVSVPPSANYGTTPWFSPAAQNVDLNNAPLNVRGANGRVAVALAVPGALTSCVVSAGGSVPLGTFNYGLTAVDFDGNETLEGPTTSVTTTTGNQTVTCNLPALPTGARGFNGYRGPNRYDNFACFAGNNPPQIVGGTTFVDSFASLCGVPTPNTSAAGSSFVSASGVGTYKLTLGGSSLTGTSGSGTLAATSRGSFVPGHLPVIDANSNVVDSGISPTNVTDYFNRAAGNLGSETNSPWTIQAGTLLVTAGAVGGNTSGQNYAVFTGVGFPNDDQSVSATWVKTGSPSVQNNSLTLRGSPTALTNYNCAPNNTGTSLTIAKFVAGSFTSLGSQSATINNGDVISFNISGSSMNCYVNGALILGATDSSITSGFPGLGSFQTYNANGANVQWKNWMASPGYVSLQRPQTWSQLQTFSPGLAIGAETVSASPRGPFNIFFPGVLTSTWTGESWTLDKAITVTRVQVQAKTAPAGCATNSVIRLTDGTTPVNLTIAAAANDSGAITQNYAAGATLTVSVQTAAAGCATSPADANAVIQYKMQ
jgi:hypothetical protein